MAVVWAAVLCGCVLLWTAMEGGRPRRRARRMLGGARPESLRLRRAAGGSGPKPGERLREVALGLRRRLERYATQRDGGGQGRWHGYATRLGWWARVEALCLPAGAVVGAATGSVLPFVAGIAAVPLAGRALRRRAERAAAERGATAVGALCGALAGDLRAGRPPHAALGDTIEAAGWPGVPELSGAARLLLSAARFGGDVPQALRAAARLSEGTRGLAAVAACWQVALDGGAGLAAALDRLAAALRAEADQRDDLRAQLAGPRSTAGLLALLPVFGVVLGAGLGARPAQILLHTPTGLLCLLVGGSLEWAGLAWTARIIRAAESGHAAGSGAGRAGAAGGPGGGPVPLPGSGGFPAGVPPYSGGFPAGLPPRSGGVSATVSPWSGGVQAGVSQYPGELRPGCRRSPAGCGPGRAALMAELVPRVDGCCRTAHGCWTVRTGWTVGRGHWAWWASRGPRLSTAWGQRWRCSPRPAGRWPSPSTVDASGNGSGGCPRRSARSARAGGSPNGCGKRSAARYAAGAPRRWPGSGRERSSEGRWAPLWGCWRRPGSGGCFATVRGPQAARGRLRARSRATAAVR